MTTSRLLIASVAAAGLLAAAAPAARAADTTFCLNAPDCPAGGVDLHDISLQAALNAAKANPGKDTLLLGPRPGGAVYAGPFTYAADSFSNTLTIRGQGATRPELVSTTPGKPVLSLIGTTGNRMEHLAVIVPGLTNTDGVLGSGITIADSTITGTGNGSLQTAVVLTAEGQIADSTVSLAHGAGVSAQGGHFDIERSRVEGSVGLTGEKADVAIENARVHGDSAGISLLREANDTGNDGLRIHASQITTSLPGATGIFARDAVTQLVRTTVASRAAAGSTGPAVAVDAQDANTTVGVDDSLLAGYAHGVRRTVAAGHTAPADFRRSQWNRTGDELGGAAAGAIVEQGMLAGEPALVDRAGGDLRLRAGSPAIDHAVHTALAPGDIDGTGDIDGNGDGANAPDSGAYEFRPAPKPAPAPTPAPTPAPSPTPAPALDRTPPSLSRLALLPRRVLRIRTSERATVRITIKRLRRGRRPATLKRTITLRLTPGTHRVRIARGLRRAGALRAGRYALTLRARDRAGNAGRPRTLRMTVRR